MTAKSIARRWDAIVPAGGASRRMGADKVLLDVGGKPMLERVLDAAAGAHRLVAVGPERSTSRAVTWCRESPPGGGPAAALRTGLEQVDCGLVVVLAADQPFADPEVVARLLAKTDGADGAVAVDDSGRPQWLCSAWHAEALRRAGLDANVSLRATLGAMSWRPVTVPAAAALDCDTPEDLRRARELAR